MFPSECGSSWQRALCQFIRQVDRGIEMIPLTCMEEFDGRAEWPSRWYSATSVALLELNGKLAEAALRSAEMERACMAACDGILEEWRSLLELRRLSEAQIIASCDRLAVHVDRLWAAVKAHVDLAMTGNDGFRLALSIHQFVRKALQNYSGAFLNSRAAKEC